MRAVSALPGLEPSSTPWEKSISKSARPWEMPALLLWAKSELVRAMEEAEAPSEAGQPQVKPTSSERRARLRAWAGGVCRPAEGAAAVLGSCCCCRLQGVCATAAACSWCGVSLPDWLGEKLTRKFPPDDRSRDPARGVSSEGRWEENREAMEDGREGA